MLDKKNVFEINQELYEKHFMGRIQKSPLEIDQSILDFGAVTCSCVFNNQGFQHALEFYPGAGDTGAFSYATHRDRPKTLVMWECYGADEPVVRGLGELNEPHPLNANLKDGVFSFSLGQQLFQVSFRTTKILPQPKYFNNRFKMRTSKPLKQATAKPLLQNYYIKTSSVDFSKDPINTPLIQHMESIGLFFVGATVMIENYPTMELSYALEKGILKQVS